MSLGRSTLKGVLWLLVQSAGARVISIASQLVLARILLPADFGVVSLVYTVTSIADALVSFGIDGVLLQRQRSIRFWAFPGFVTSLALGAAGFLFVAGAAPLFARAYHAPPVAALATILAVSMPVNALSTLPAVRMRNELNFRFPAVYGTLDGLATQAATVALALNGFGPLSFVLPIPVFAMVKVAAYWWRAPVPLTPRWRGGQFGFLIGNGLAVFGSRLSGAIVSQGDYATLGLIATRPEVGFFYFAFRLAAQPVWVLAGNFANVMFPALVQLKGDPQRQLQAALKAARLLAFVILPASFLQAVIAAPVLRLFFGAKWTGSIPLAELLSLGLPFDAPAWVAGALMSARGDFKVGLVYSAVQLPSFFVLVGLGAWLGRGLGVASAEALYYLVLGPAYCLACFGRYGASPRDVLSIFARPPLIAGAAMGAAWLVSVSPLNLGSALLQVVEAVATGGGLYLALMWTLERGVLAELLERFGAIRGGGFTRRLGARLGLVAEA